MAINDLLRTNRSPINFLIFGLVLIAVSTFAMSILYFFLDSTQTAFESVNCDLTANAFGETCQDLFDLVLYPFLNAKSILIYMSIFFIFILVVGILMAGYHSGTEPKMLGILIILEIALTYASIWPANIYRTLLEIEIIRTALIEFTVYNTIMLHFPWFVFIVSLFSIALGVINFQKSKVNSSNDSLNY